MDSHSESKAVKVFREIGRAVSFAYFLGSTWVSVLLIMSLETEKVALGLGLLVLAGFIMDLEARKNNKKLHMVIAYPLVGVALLLMTMFFNFLVHLPK